MQVDKIYTKWLKWPLECEPLVIVSPCTCFLRPVVKGWFTASRFPASCSFCTITWTVGGMCWAQDYSTAFLHYQKRVVVGGPESKRPLIRPFPGPLCLLETGRKEGFSFDHHHGVVFCSSEQCVCHLHRIGHCVFVPCLIQPVQLVSLIWSLHAFMF